MARIVTTYFPVTWRSRHDFERLLAAYRASAEAVGVPLEVHELPPPERMGKRGAIGFNTENSYKLDYWATLLSESTEPIIFTDCDMLMLGDPSDGFNGGDWDVALTQRKPEGQPRWFNAGVVFARPNDAARRYMEAWRDANAHLLNRPKEHKRWKSKYAGMNQAALGMAMEKEMLPDDCKVGHLPCALYNCGDNEWRKADIEQIRLLHVKGVLRDVVLGRNKSRKLDHLVNAWRRFDQAMEAAL